MGQEIPQTLQSSAGDGEGPTGRRAKVFGSARNARSLEAIKDAFPGKSALSLICRTTRAQPPRAAYTALAPHSKCQARSGTRPLWAHSRVGSSQSWSCLRTEQRPLKSKDSLANGCRRTPNLNLQVQPQRSVEDPAGTLTSRPIRHRHSTAPKFQQRLGAPIQSQERLIEESNKKKVQAVPHSLATWGCLNQVRESSRKFLFEIRAQRRGRHSDLAVQLVAGELPESAEPSKRKRLPTRG